MIKFYAIINNKNIKDRRMRNCLTNTFKKILRISRAYGWYSLIFVFVIILVNYVFFLSVKTQEESILLNEMNAANQDINMFKYHVSQLLSLTKNDIDVIKDSNESQQYLQNKNNSTLSDFESLIYRISVNKPQFTAVSLLDLDGNELFSVYRDQGNLVRSDDLQVIQIDQYVDEVESSDSIFISKIFLDDDKPVVYILSPLYQDGSIDSMILFAYDANHFLSIFNEYATGFIGHFSLAFLNDNNLWVVNKDTENIELVESNETKEEMLQLFSSSDYSSSVSLGFEEIDYHHLTNQDHFMTIIANVNEKQAIEANINIWLKENWVIYVIDSVLILVYFYLGYFINKKNDSQIFLNTNIYLSEKNNDGIIILNKDLTTDYVNEAFVERFGYELRDFANLPADDVLHTLFIEKPNYKSTTSDYQYLGHVWNQSRLGVYYLNFMRVKKEEALSESNARYVCVYSNSNIRLQEFDIRQLDKMYHVLLPIMERCVFIPNKTVLILLKVDHIDIDDFVTFLLENKSLSAEVFVIHQNYIYLLIHLNHKNLEQVIVTLDNLLTLYLRQPDVSSHFDFYYSVVKADEKINSFKAMIRASLIGLEIPQKHSQLTHRIFDTEMIKQSERQIAIKGALDNAFENDEFFMNYQLLVDLRSNRISGVESLLRWVNMDLGWVGPSEFIPIIENSHYVNQLSIMVLKNIIKDWTPYAKELPDYFRISLNVIYNDFENENILEEMIHLIESSSIPAKHFLFEITENQYIDRIDKTNEIIERLHQKKIHVGIDDFGTGYSSISSIKDIHVDFVKIDRVFLENYPHNNNGDMFLAIANLVHTLGKPIVVEGIEIQEQMHFVKKHQCRFAQGYYIAKPASINDVIQKLKHQEE